MSLYKVHREKPIYLSESITGNICDCLKIVRGHLSTVRSLQYEHEEADHHLMLHNDDAVRSGYKKVIV